MRILWLHKFNGEGTIETVLSWAEGAANRGLAIHLALLEIPAFLHDIYQDYTTKKGLQTFLNINTQQIQNLIYYRGFNLLHVHHSDLYPLTAELSNHFKIPWLASCLEEKTSVSFDALDRAQYVICASSTSLQTVTQYFSPSLKKNLLLLPPGIKTVPKNFSPLKTLCPLYVGPLQNNHLTPFQDLSRVIQKTGCTLDVMSWQKPAAMNGIFYPWDPDFSSLLPEYNLLISFGSYLLQGIAAGKVALIMEEEYGGIFSPWTAALAPNFRAANKTGETFDRQERLKNDLHLLSQLPSLTQLQDENWSYARENHDLNLIGEKIVRLYRRLQKT